MCLRVKGLLQNLNLRPVRLRQGVFVFAVTQSLLFALNKNAGNLAEGQGTRHLYREGNILKWVVLFRSNLLYHMQGFSHGAATSKAMQLIGIAAAKYTA